MGLHSTELDTIIIGAGQAGPSLASALDARGEKVALIERGNFGGTCLIDGCRPTKALRASAHAAHVARSSGDLGVTADAVRVDVAQAISRKDALIEGWRDRNTDYYTNHETISYVQAAARLAGRDGDRFVIQAGERTLTAARVIINTGASAVPPDVPGLDTVPWLDHHSILDLKALPRRLVVLGGSYIGLELGQIWARFGSQVTILERGERVASREDADVSDAIAAFLRQEGLEVRTGVVVARVERADAGAGAASQVGSAPGGNGPGDGTAPRGNNPGDGTAVGPIRIVLDGGGVVEADALLVAAGRTPNSRDLGLETVGVELDAHGYITTDEHFASNVPGIYAVGDVNGRGAFTHTSYQDFEILADHLAGGTRSVAGRVTTYAMFTDPPLGRVGLTEAQARAHAETTRARVSVSTYPMDKLTRAVLNGQTAGLARLIVDEDADRILGATVLGPEGDEVVQVISLAMHAGMPASALATWLPVHPTVAEFWPTIYAARE